MVIVSKLEVKLAFNDFKVAEKNVKKKHLLGAVGNFSVFGGVVDERCLAIVYLFRKTSRKMWRKNLP